MAHRTGTRRASARRRRGTREEKYWLLTNPRAAPTPRVQGRAGALFAVPGLSAAAQAADRRGSGRVRAVRIGAPGRPRDARRAREGLRRAAEDAAPRRQRRRRGRRLRRAGRHPARDLAGGDRARAGTLRTWRSTPRSPSATSSSPARQTSSKIKRDAREIFNRGGLRVLAEREDQVDSSALGPTAREEEPHFWQVGGARPGRGERATGSCSTSTSSSRRSSTCTSPRSRRTPASTR